MSAGLSRCAVPVSIHCDHLIQASSGAHADLEVTAFPPMHEPRLIYGIECDRFQQRGLRLSGECGQEVRNRVLEAWVGDYPPDRPGKLRRSRNVDVRPRSSLALHKCNPTSF